MVLRQIATESSPERSAKSLSHSFFVVPFLSPTKQANNCFWLMFPVFRLIFGFYGAQNDCAHFHHLGFNCLITQDICCTELSGRNSAVQLGRLHKVLSVNANYTIMAKASFSAYVLVKNLLKTRGKETFRPKKARPILVFLFVSSLFPFLPQMAKTSCFCLPT